MSCYQELRDKGYKLTPQRLMVLEVLHEADGHISAPDIYERVRLRYPWINRSTVYRALELMKDLGLVTETKLDGDKLYYHHAEKGHHHHLVCQECGAVIDLDEATLLPLEDVLRRDYHFEAELKHLAIFGRCGACSPKSTASARMATSEGAR